MGIDWVDFLPSLAGCSCFSLFVLGIIGGVIYLVRRRRLGAAAPENPQPHIATPPMQARPQVVAPSVPTSVQCSSCGTNNPAENNFCEQCGIKLPA